MVQRPGCELQPGRIPLYTICSMLMLLLSPPHLLDQVDCGSNKALHEHERIKSFEESLQ